MNWCPGTYFERRQILNSPLKVAICHEWLDNVGGGEKVLFELAGLFENPTIFTLWENEQTTRELDFEIKTSFLQYFPSKFRRSLGILFMPLAWKLFERELQTFDLVINSSWAFAHSAGGGHPRKISYIHTPGRYWWYPSIDQRTQVKIPGVLLYLIKRIDLRLAQKNNTFIANSIETKNRILESWGQESFVVHPPVNLDFYIRQKEDSSRQSFLLGVGRFVGYKNHHFVIKLGEALGLKVVLAGHGPLLENLKSDAINSSAQIDVIDNPTDFELRDLYSTANCLVYPTFEDFGIVPVEAMGCGLRVLGLSQGGLLETVKDGLSGRLVKELSIAAFVDGFHELPEKSDFEIRRTVEGYDSKEFAKKIRECILNKLETQS